MKKIIPIIVIIIVIIAGLGAAWKLTKNEAPPIGNDVEKADMIRIDYPHPNQVIQSPLTVRGEARGSWFFEASFPVVLTDWDGLIIAQGIATAKSDWMTTEFVPFEATLTFEINKDVYSNRGALVLRKDNPSGLPENDDALEIPIIFAGVAENTPPQACTQEAKQCPDGSYVGRTGPNCEFAACIGDTPEWLAIKQAIYNCEVESTMQTHSLEVSAKLKNGGTLRAIEPSIDDIIIVAEEAQEKCGKIRMGTE